MIDLNHLVKRIPGHRALQNRFYDAWESGPLQLPELRILARNYGAWVQFFPNALALLFTKTPSAVGKTEIAKTLFSEMGSGNPRRVHWTLLDAFFNDLATAIDATGQLERDRLQSELELLPATRSLLEGERDLYGHSEPAVGVGAQLALEWQAYTMLRRLYEGARNYQHFWHDEDAFHESCEYFYAHIGHTEKEHKLESIRAAEIYLSSERSYEAGKQGFDQHLDLIAGFWEEIADAGLTVRSLDSSLN